jgi:hypothetical protein
MIRVVHPGSGSRIRIRNTEATVYHLARILGAHLFEKPDQRSPSGAGLRIRIRKDLPCDLRDPDLLALKNF